MQEIDVDEIMREVRADIDKRDIKENPIRFREAYEDELPFVWPQNFDQKILHDETMNAMALWDTSVEPLDNAVGLKGKVKKMLNRMAIYSMKTHMVSQNAFNTSVINALMQVNKLAEENKNMQGEIKQLKSEIEELRKRE